MILDERAIFSDKQLITATAPSTSHYDLGVMGTTFDGVTLNRAIGKGGMIPLLVQVTEAFDNLTSLTIALETDSVTGFGSPKVVMSVVVLLADLAIGFHIPGYGRIPRELTERFLRFNYTVTGAAPTVGRITAGIVAAVDGAYQG